MWNDEEEDLNLAMIGISPSLEEERVTKLKRPVLSPKPPLEYYKPLSSTTHHSLSLSLSTDIRPFNNNSTSTLNNSTSITHHHQVASSHLSSSIFDPSLQAHHDSTPPSPHSSSSDSTSRTFVSNPRPSHALSHGVSYGPIKFIHDKLDSASQFPDSVSLSKSSSDPNSSKALFAIQAVTWNQLLTYFMWHGNSRIEAAPLDIAEAQENKTPTKLALFVHFSYHDTPRNPVTSIRLILELLSGSSSPPQPSFGQPSQSHSPSSSSTCSPQRPSRLSLSSRHRSSMSFSTLSNSSISSETWSADLIELPGPYLDLPVNLSTLASLLHEIRTVASMSACSSLAFRTAKPGINSDRLKRLYKAIEREQSRTQGLGLIDEGKLLKRGIKWLRRKVTVSKLSAGGIESEKVDGEGLPLPNGATLVQPWDSDWS